MHQGEIKKIYIYQITLGLYAWSRGGEGGIFSFRKSNSRECHPIISLCSPTVGPDMPLAPNCSMRYTAQSQNPFKLRLLLGEREWLVIECINFPVLFPSKIPIWAITPGGWEKERTAGGHGTFWGLLPVCLNHCPNHFAISSMQWLPWVILAQYSIQP